MHGSFRTAPAVERLATGIHNLLLNIFCAACFLQFQLLTLSLSCFISRLSPRLMAKSATRCHGRDKRDMNTMRSLPTRSKVMSCLLTNSCSRSHDLSSENVKTPVPLELELLRPLHLPLSDRAVLYRSTNRTIFSITLCPGAVILQSIRALSTLISPSLVTCLALYPACWHSSHQPVLSLLSLVYLANFVASR